MEPLELCLYRYFMFVCDVNGDVVSRACKYRIASLPLVSFVYTDQSHDLRVLNYPSSPNGLLVHNLLNSVFFFKRTIIGQKLCPRRSNSMSYRIATC